MPNQFLTIKDVVALDRLTSPDSVGLVDNIVNVAPELDRIPGRPISGISYEATILTALGSNGGFRKINSGRPFSAFSIDEKRFNCFPWDSPFSVDEALIQKGESQGTPMGETLTTFATAGARQKALDMGKQFYQGSLNDPLGPPGMLDFLYTQRTQVDSRTGLKINQVVDAGGTTNGQCEQVWFLKTGPQGVHWMWGNGRGILMNPWVRLPGMPSPDSTAGNPLYSTQWRSNMFGFIGTSMAQYHAIGCVNNVNPVQTGTTNGVPTFQAPLTDYLAGLLWGLFPISMKPDICFASQKAIVSLQMQRTVTNFSDNKTGNRNGNASVIADFPTNLPTCGGIPIIPTDSIVPGNQLVLN